jgi:D-glucosaminate-6-phosphate ammonia-lyase
MGHMVNYGAPVPQGIALSGAEVVPLGTAALCETYHLDAALEAGLAAAVYVVSHHTVREGELPLDLFVERCARRAFRSSSTWRANTT